MADTYHAKNSNVLGQQLVVQRLVIPFSVTSSATPASKVLTTDEPSILHLQTQGISQITVDPDAPVPVPPPSLGTAYNFAVLASSTITNTGTTIITGDLGLSPGTSVTGAPTVIGTSHVNDATAAAAQVDLTAAYNNLASLTPTSNLTGQDLGTLTLGAGIYKYNTSAQLTGTLVLDAQGNSDAVWVFQIGSTLTTASASAVTVINGGTNANVFFQVGSSATIGTTTAFIGNILANVSITVTTGASILGRALARTGAVTLDTNIITATYAPASVTIFDLVVADSTGAINLLVDVSPMEFPDHIFYCGDRVVKIENAIIIDRLSGVKYPCYHNTVLPDRDSTLTKMLLNCPTGVNLSTTSLNACLIVEYTTYQ